MFSSRASYPILTCPTTNWELLKIFRCRAPASLTTFTLAISASYSTSLLVVQNSKCKAYYATSPSGSVKISSAPNPDEFDEPSTCRVHSSSGSDSAFASSHLELSPTSELSTPFRLYPFRIVHSRMKSTNTRALMKGLRGYYTSNYKSFRAHITIHPEVSDRWRTVLIS